MSQIKMDSEDIAEIRNALQVIQGYTELIRGYTVGENRPKKIMEQVERIYELLPDVKSKGGKQ